MKITVQLGRGGPKATIEYGDEKTIEEEGKPSFVANTTIELSETKKIQNFYNNPGDALNAALKAMVGVV